MKLEEMIEVITAYKNGKEIERSRQDFEDWHHIANPLWNFVDYKYRVKKTEKILHQYLNSDGGTPAQYRVSPGFYETIAEAQSHLMPPLRAIRKLDYTKTIIKEQ